MWDNALKHTNLEHEHKGWFNGRMADALWNIFHGSWNDCKSGIEDEVVSVGPVGNFPWIEKGNWGFAVDDSDEEKIVGVARFGNLGSRSCNGSS